MKQRRKLAGVRIDGTDIAAFIPIAHGTAKSEILCDRLPTMLHSDHVVNFAFRQSEAFGDMAVFASSVGLLSY